MRAIDLDFVPRPRLHGGVAALLLAAGLLALALALVRVVALKTELDHLGAELDDAQRAASHQRRPLKPTAGTSADSDSLAPELAQANAVVASLNLGWASLFKRIEAIKQPGVTLLAVQPESGTVRRLRLSGEARRLEDALAYIAQVAGTPGFDNTHLVSHEAVADLGPGGAGNTGTVRLRFALVADWAGQR